MNHDTTAPACPTPPADAPAYLLVTAQDTPAHLLVTAQETPALWVTIARPADLLRAGTTLAVRVDYGDGIDQLDARERVILRALTGHVLACLDAADMAALIGPAEARP